MFDIFSIHYNLFPRGIDRFNYLENMTHIIAGKLKNIPFLMVDCIRTTIDKGNKTYSFTNKLKKSEALQNTYYVITGDELLLTAINVYDNWLLVDNKNDLLTGTTKESIREIANIYLHIFNEKYKDTKAKIEENQRAFFINDSEIFCYDLVFVSNEINNINKGQIPNNFKITAVPNSYPSGFTLDEKVNLFDYCKKEIVNSVATDFKNKFTFLTFDNNTPILHLPYKNVGDILLDLNRCDYDKI